MPVSAFSGATVGGVPLSFSMSEVIFVGLTISRRDVKELPLIRRAAAERQRRSWPPIVEATIRRRMDVRALTIATVAADRVALR
jgi:hypothetical protein